MYSGEPGVGPSTPHGWLLPSLNRSLVSVSLCLCLPISRRVFHIPLHAVFLPIKHKVQNILSAFTSGSCLTKYIIYA